MRYLVALVLAVICIVSIYALMRWGNAIIGAWQDSERDVSAGEMWFVWMVMTMNRYWYPFVAILLACFVGAAAAWPRLFPNRFDS